MTEPVYQIYMAQDPEGREYIGATRHCAEKRVMIQVIPPRAWPGKEKACLSDGIKRFGLEAFKVFWLASARGVANAAEVEKALIKQRGTLRPHGYNGNIGGGGLTSKGKITRRKVVMVQA
jgi:hypothetical protein